MAPWIESVVNWAHSFGARVAKLLTPAATAVETAIDASKDKIEGDAIQFFENAAKTSVIAAASAPGDSIAKAAFALTTFFGILAEQGITWGINEAKILLESAYANWKATQVAPIETQIVS